MKLRLDRNPYFWTRVAQHPAVEPFVLQGAPEDYLAEFVALPEVTPLAAENGGFLFLAKETGSYELHTLFTPEGWGREVAQALRIATRHMFDGKKAKVLTTLEQEGYWRSRPPLSHGWKPAGEFANTGIGSVRQWDLTRAAWLASAVGKKECRS
jgi:hypothetical protein